MRLPWRGWRLWKPKHSVFLRVAELFWQRPKRVRLEEVFEAETSAGNQAGGNADLAPQWGQSLETRALIRDILPNAKTVKYARLMELIDAQERKITHIKEEKALQGFSEYRYRGVAEDVIAREAREMEARRPGMALDIIYLMQHTLEYVQLANRANRFTLGVLNDKKAKGPITEKEQEHRTELRKKLDRVVGLNEQRIELCQRVARVFQGVARTRP